MSFRIEWQNDVIGRLAEDWEALEASDQRAVMDALDETDRVLQMSPMTVGESRAEDVDRVLIHLPVVIVYRVDLDLRVVRILGAGIHFKR